MSGGPLGCNSLKPLLVQGGKSFSRCGFVYGRTTTILVPGARGRIEKPDSASLLA
jgi:hypothetical protein